MAIGRIDNDCSRRFARMERHELPGFGVGCPLLVDEARGRFGLRCSALSSVFTATCWAKAAVPKLVDASTAIAAAIAPRNTKRDVEIINLSRRFHGFGAHPRRL